MQVREVWGSDAIRCQVKIDRRGRLHIPATMRAHLGLVSGEEVLLVADNSELRVIGSDAAFERARSLEYPIRVREEGPMKLAKPSL